MIASLVFYMFSLVLTGSALAVVISRNPVHAVLFLILAFFNAAGLFVLLGAEFLAMLLVIVYVGAVAVLFLFVVMMLNVTIERFREGLTKYFASALIVASVLFAEMIFLLTSNNAISKHEMGSHALPAHLVTDVVGKTNTQQLGSLIYTDYALIFQASGIVLLVAMIGAIALTFEKRTRMRKQNVNAQNARNPRTAIEVVKVETGKGIKQGGVK